MIASMYQSSTCNLSKVNVNTEDVLFVMQGSLNSSRCPCFDRDLSSNKLSGRIPATIENLVNLTDL